MGRGEGGGSGCKIREKIFRSIIMRNSAIFSGKNSVKFRNFIDFSENIIKIGIFC